MKIRDNNKIYNAAVSFMMCLCLVLSFSCMQPESDIAFASTESDDYSFGYYGLTKLSTLENAEALVICYKGISFALSNLNKEFIFPANINNLSDADIDMVFYAVLNDNPQYFWVGSSMALLYHGRSIYGIRFTYDFASGKEFETCKQLVEDKVDEIVAGVPKNSLDYEKELYFYKYLIENVEFCSDTKNCGNLYGALIEGKAVCEGYTRAFQYLLYRAGIQSCAVMGYVGDSWTENSSPNHIWNLVYLEGEYHFVDVTWDDTQYGPAYLYFNVGTETIQQDHFISNKGIEVPICNNYDRTKAEKNAKLACGVRDTSISAKKEIKSGSARISWKKSDGYKVDSYQVYKSGKKSSGYSKVISTGSKYYKKSKQKSKTAFYYKIRGVREIAGQVIYTKWSNIVSY